MLVSGSMLLMEERCVSIRTNVHNGGEVSFMPLEQALIVRHCQEFCQHQSPM